jgi:hypothetical protein
MLSMSGFTGIPDKRDRTVEPEETHPQATKVFPAATFSRRLPYFTCVPFTSKDKTP